MDNWDDLLEQSIAARMAALEAEVAALTPAATPTAEEAAPQSEAVPAAPATQEVAVGEIRTITLTIPDAEAPTEEAAAPAPQPRQRRRRTEKPNPLERLRTEGLPVIGKRSAEKRGTSDGDAASEKKRQRQSRMVSLKARWLWNSMGAVCLIMVLFGALSAILLCNYFYSAMSSGLESRAQTAASFFANYTTESEYRERASSYVSSFDEADAIELEFIDTSGEIIYSSYAYQQTAGVVPGTKDIVQALENGTLSSWIGKDPFTGERIMAVSAPVIQNGSVRGVIRLVTSTAAVDRQVLVLSLLVLALVLGILLLIYSTNLYFVKSIAEPIANITETTKRIAAGSYGVQIEKEHNDEIGELVDTINDMSLKISQAEKVKSEFISSVSHELRTPLTAINGWGETLVHGDITDPRDLQKGLSIIVSEAKRLTKMVEELLEFSRIEDGRFTLRVEQIDIKAELEDAVYTYREFFRKKGISLEYQDCPEEFPPIPGDPERLRQVFSNLLDNAAKHGGGGKRIAVAIDAEGDYVRIRIRDFGHGIPPEELPFVKTKFYKGSSKARGSGIGLAVCEEIAQRHNGSLEIANADGGGCVVTLWLPLRATI